MVLFYESDVVSPPAVIYMGVDKHENEHLIRWGWPEDVWFHVDKVSSAHVYLRLESGQTIESIPQALIDDCAQLVKANSIQGNKMPNVDVVYTMWENLKKTGDMAIGQIGFKEDRKVKTVRVAKRINEIVNRLEKTERSVELDYRASREERDTNERQKLRESQRHQKQAQLEEEKRKLAERALRSYDGMMTEECMSSNRDGGNDSDEFM